MKRKPCVLITGFGPFPGAPYNPTERLVSRLVRVRRPALADVKRIGHIFHVSYAAVDRELSTLLTEHHPDAVLMFGLAQRTPYARIETRARNTVTALWPDADHNRLGSSTITPHDIQSRTFGAHTAILLQAARNSGIWVKSSRDAGRYLCNYLCWKTTEVTGKENGPRLAAFIHIPAMPRDTTSRLPTLKKHVAFEELVDAGEAILMTMVQLARQSSAIF
jgi:pyroglutamyl-peptidase